MGGIDLVNYLLAYENGTKVKGATPVSVEDAYIYHFNGYEWYFESEENRDLFVTSPYYYIPQFGGFCSLAISAEYCPSYAWDVGCLGPSADLEEYEVISDRLYFFLSEQARLLFLSTHKTLVKKG